MYQRPPTRLAVRAIAASACEPEPDLRTQIRNLDHIQAILLKLYPPLRGSKFNPT